MKSIDVVKLDHEGKEKFRYSGTVLAQDESWILIEAFFAIINVPVGPISFNIGDRFVETYYNDRWYNIFEVYDGNTEVFKGYYCNIGMPALIRENEVSYRDLALDLVVLPDGRQVVLDEDEFEELNLDDATARKARLALEELQDKFNHEIKPPEGTK
jgi:predicted RNA-binding protein associated with RNAse of E/G family